MRYLLDTDIVSYSIKPQPPSSLLEWWDRQRKSDLFISALTVAEIWNGMLEMPVGKRRDWLFVWFHGPDGPLESFKNRILPFDEHAALIWARLIADGKARGKPRSEQDMIIAATAEANGCIIVTNNEKDFAGLEFINPLGGWVHEPAPLYLVHQRESELLPSLAVWSCV